ncbi:hypothetical protein [Ramlibacter sp.]|uniref:hypothetical protein n=1 Tax=Ramlibacter sp. TaxID=1917967 RepID=UPI003D0FEDED
MTAPARAPLPPLVTGSDSARQTTYAVFAAIAERAPAAGFRFSTSDLRAWVPYVTRAEANRISARLVQLGFVRQVESRVRERSNRFALTVEGFEGVRTAQAGRYARTPGLRKQKRPDAFIDRLWALMRMRNVLDSVTAASTLVDAGSDEQALARATKTAAQYLASWSRQGFVAESRRRAGNGRKQYVLQKDAVRAPVGTCHSDNNSKA